jgi:signal transduction histidine kinase
VVPLLTEEGVTLPLKEETPMMLSTLVPGRSERRMALGIAVVLLVCFLITAPFAKVQLAQLWPFIPFYASALIVTDLITAVLLFAQFQILRSRALLILGSAYLFTAFITFAHMLTFPNLFGPTGLLGAGGQTTAWMYMFWHGGFPLFILAYTWLKNQAGSRASVQGSTGTAVTAAVVTVSLAVVGITTLATMGHDLFPPIMAGNRYTPAMIFVVSSVWAFSLLAFVVLWRQRSRATVLDLWLMVVMCAWMFDIALSAVLNAGRFDLGFYFGRVYGLLAASFVLVMLLLENSALYAQLVDRSSALQAMNKELEAFSYSVSHDLRAPLRAMDGYASMLNEDYGTKLDDDGRRLLGRVRANAKRMGQLIEDLLAFSRLGRQPLKTERIALNELVDGVLADLRPSYSHAVYFTIGNLGTVEADPSLLKQALTNLLSNAIKFTRRTDKAEIEIGCQDNGGAKIYFVKDNGAGFDMRYADKLFGVFQRLHSADDFEGTGVGLAIVQRVIARHGGRVWADATPEQGATFYFTFGSA